MNISPAQINLAQTLGLTSQSPPESASVQGISHEPASAEQAPPAAPPSAFELSTSLQIDSQHQVYYEFVDKMTGAVVFEIPPEALRAIAESLKIPLEGSSDFHNLDVST